MRPNVDEEPIQARAARDHRAQTQPVEQQRPAVVRHAQRAGGLALATEDDGLAQGEQRAGAESWYGKWRVDGRRVNRLLGERRSPRSPDGMTIKQAEVALRDAMAALTSEELERLAQDKLRGGKTLGEVLDAYLAARDLKDSTATDYAMHVRVHLDPFFDDKTVGDITAKDVERLLVHLTALGLKVKTVRTYVTTLSTLLTYAVRKGWAGRPAGWIAAPRQSHHAPAGRRDAAAAAAS